MIGVERSPPHEADIVEQERLSRLLEATTDALWMAAADGSVTRSSPSWHSFTGQSEPQQLGWGWLNAVLESDRERVRVALRIGLATRSVVRCEQWLRRADGVNVYTALAATPILDDQGRVCEWIGAFTNIGEDRPDAFHLEGQSRALEELAAGGPLKEVLDFIIRGVEAQEPGTRCSILLVRHRRLWSGAAPSLPPAYVAAIEGLAIGAGVGSCGHAAHTGELTVAADIMTHPNWEAGRAIASAHGLRSCWSMPILSPSREVLGVFAVYHDQPYEPGPSDVQRVAAALRIAGVAIERHRTDQALRARNQELVEADRRKDAFLAMLAHELRNPLAPLRLAQHLIDSCADDPATLRRLRDIIGRQTSQLARLVDDLLDVSRIKRGAIELNLERVSVQSLISGALENIRSRVTARKHRLEVDLPAEPAWVDADPLRMIQVLSNLFDNAVKYTNEGGVIYASAGVNGDHIEISVGDTGVGMLPDMLEVAFQPFMQADTSLARSQGGLGIGLTVARSLVEMHGGTISAASVGLGQGSEFVVRLPLAARERLPKVGAHGEDLPAEASRRRKRVLVVDDNRDAADTMEMALVTSGHDVRVAYDGPQALAAAQAFVPDVAFVDIGLPGMDGYEVARRLRAKAPRHRLRLVAVTGYGGRGDREESQRAGFDRHLAKPVDLPTILRELAAVEQAELFEETLQP